MGNDSTELCTKCSVMTTWNLNAESALNTYPQLSVYSGPYKLVSSHIKGVFWLCWFSGVTLHGCYVRSESQRGLAIMTRMTRFLEPKYGHALKCTVPHLFLI